MNVKTIAEQYKINQSVFERFLVEKKGVTGFEDIDNYEISSESLGSIFREFEQYAHERNIDMREQKDNTIPTIKVTLEFIEKIYKIHKDLFARFLVGEMGMANSPDLKKNEIEDIKAASLFKEYDLYEQRLKEQKLIEQNVKPIAFKIKKRKPKRNSSNESSAADNIPTPEQLGEDFIHSLAVTGKGLKTHCFGKKYALLYDKKQLIDYQDLVWVFPEVTNVQRKMYGVIPAGKWVENTVVLVTRNQICRLDLDRDSERERDLILGHLSTFAPWALTGYSDELSAICQHQFPALVSIVEERKKTICQN